MRKSRLQIMVLLTVLLLTACGSDSNTAKEAKGTVAPEEFDQMYSTPKDYKGYEVEFIGQVFVEPERDADGLYLQVYAKPEQYEQNTIVKFNDADIDVKTDDYVKIIGIVKDEFKGENLMGGKIVAPLIEATSLQVVDYITAVSPTIETIEVDESIKQHDLEIYVEKIEIAKNQTRVYAKVTNDTPDTAYVDLYDAKLIIGNKQIETIDDYDANFPEIPYELLDGIEAEGIILFDAIDPETETMKIHIEAHSDDYDLDFSPYIIEINTK